MTTTTAMGGGRYRQHQHRGGKQSLEANSRNGFLHEVSFDALIRNNVFKENGTDRSWMGSGS